MKKYKFALEYVCKTQREKYIKALRYLLEKEGDSMKRAGIGKEYRLEEGVSIKEGKIIHPPNISTLKLYNKKDVEIEIDPGMPILCGLGQEITFRSKNKSSLEEELEKIGVTYEPKEIKEDLGSLFD